MPKAVWNGQVIAQSQECVTVEGNIYFPPGAIDQGYFRESETTTVCPWKGTANYYDVVINDQVNQDAAWYYADPKPEAQNIAGYIAFWKGVQVN